MSGPAPRGVAIIGRAGTGKTTLADALVRMGLVEHRASFAQALKDDLANLGVDKSQPWARELMVAYGQNRRAVSADYWIERLRFALYDDFDGSVIDDCRFPNELEFLRERGYLIVRLVCDADERAGRGIPPEFTLSEDDSETLADREQGDVTIDTTDSSVELSALVVMTAFGAFA